MHPPTRNPFDTRPPGNPDTAKFLAALGDPQAAKVYREAMGDEGDSPTTEGQEPEPTSDELARLQAIQDRERAHELVELRKREYLAWVQEFDIGGDDPQQWIADTFTFNTDGTVEVDGNLNLSANGLTRLPTGLTLVNGDLNLARNQLTSLEGLPHEIHGDLYLNGNQLTFLEGLPSEIHGDLDLSSNQLTSLDGLQGWKVDGNLYLPNIPATSIPEGIELGGEVVVNVDQTTLKADAVAKGYRVTVQL